MSVVLLALIFSVYWQVAHFPLTDIDDGEYITNNVFVRDGLTSRGISWAFGIGRAGTWQPVTWMSHMLDVQIFGMAPGVLSGTGGHHLTSVLLHALNAILLFIALNRMTGFVWRSAFVAALFALHPLHVESVAWVAARKDVLSTFFMMLALLTYDAYVKRPAIGRYLLLMITFGLGLMSKQMLVSLPLLLLLLDYWPLRRLTSRSDVGRLIREKAPLLVMSLAGSVVAVLAQSASGAISAYPLVAGVANAIVTYAIYLYKMFWPTALAHYYPLSATMQWTGWQIAGSALLIAGMTYLAIRVARNWPMVLVGWCWYLVSLLPVIGLVPIGGHARADRFTYIPLIGVFIAIAYAVPRLIERIADRKQSMALALMSGCMIAAMLPLTYKQIGYWNGSEALYRHTLSVTEDNWFVHGALASILFRQAEALRIGNKLEAARTAAVEAAEHARVAVRLHPRMEAAHTNLAGALTVLAKIETRGKEKAELLNEAEREYETVLSISPGDAISHNNLAGMYLDRNDLDGAIRHYEASLRSDPNSAAVHYNLAIALDRNARKEEAIEHYRKALALYPADFTAYWSRVALARLLMRKGEQRESAKLLTEAVQINKRTHIDAAGNVAQRKLTALGEP